MVEILTQRRLITYSHTIIQDVPLGFINRDISFVINNQILFLLILFFCWFLVFYNCCRICKF